jgi:Holliday junction resolvase RusA-like endonuclease
VGTVLSFNVNGEPRPQGSKTPVVRGGRAFLIEGTGDSPRKHKAWRKAVQDAAQELADEIGHTPIDAPVEVKIEFRLHKPNSKTAAKYWADRKPDIDKLVRSILDSIAGKDKPLVREDSRVVRLVAEKRYIEPEEQMGCWITVEEIAEGDTQLTLELDE